MPETILFFWTDRSERAFAVLREHAGHWRVEWGYRDPPASDNYVQQGEHETSTAEEVIQTMLRQVRRLSADPADADGTELKLREALRSAQP